MSKYHPAEIAKLKEDVAEHQLSVVVIGDWYNVDVMKKINFYDDNAKQWWTPLTGGANVPAINDLLESYGIILGNSIYDGEIRMGDQKAAYSSGTSIVRFPAGGYLAKFPLTDQTSQILRNKSIKHQGVAILGVYTPPHPAPPPMNDTDEPADPSENSKPSGTIAVFGDSSCFDDANERTACNWLLEHILQVTNFRADPTAELQGTRVLDDTFLDSAWNMLAPVRAEDVLFSKHSRVVGRNKPLVCPAQLTQSHPYTWDDAENLTHAAWVEREIVPATRVTPRTYTTDENTSEFGYLPMYFLGCMAVVFLIALAVKARYSHGKDKSKESPNLLGSPSRRLIV